MNRTQKAQFVNDLREELSAVEAIVVTDYRGITVPEDETMRSEFRKNDCKYLVVKNTLLRKAIKDTKLEALGEYLSGPTAIAYSNEDPTNPARVAAKFAKSIKSLELKGGFADGQLLDIAGVNELAAMKGKSELRAELLAQFGAPAQALVRLFNAVPQNFAYLLSNRQAGGGKDAG